MRKLYIFLLCVKTCLCSRETEFSKAFIELKSSVQSEKAVCVGLNRVVAALDKENYHYTTAKEHLKHGIYRKFGDHGHQHFSHKILTIAAIGEVIKGMKFQFHRSMLESFPSIEQKFADLKEIVRGAIGYGSVSEAQLENLDQILTDYWYVVIPNELTVSELITGIRHLRTSLLFVTQSNPGIQKLHESVANLGQKDYFNLLKTSVFSLAVEEFMAAPEDNMLFFILSSTPHQELFGLIKLYRQILYEPGLSKNLERYPAELESVFRQSIFRHNKDGIISFIKLALRKTMLAIIHVQQHSQKPLQICKNY